MEETEYIVQLFQPFSAVKRKAKHVFRGLSLFVNRAGDKFLPRVQKFAVTFFFRKKKEMDKMISTREEQRFAAENNVFFLIIFVIFFFELFFSVNPSFP